MTYLIFATVRIHSQIKNRIMRPMMQRTDIKNERYQLIALNNLISQILMLWWSGAGARSGLQIQGRFTA